MIPDRVAVILVVPRLIMFAVASPVLEMVAIVMSEEFHTTEVVRSGVLPSLKFPVAVNCWVPFRKIVALDGVTVMDSSTAGVTVSVVEAEMVPDVALMVVVPAPTELASPFEPAVLLIVVTTVLEELQTTDDVRFCVELSENVPVAMNCWVLPRAILGFAGVTVRDDNMAGITVSVAGLERIPLNNDVMVAMPSLTAVAIPFEPAALLMVATPELDVAQVATVVKIWVFASASVPVAVNCCVVPLAMLAAVGVTAVDTRAEALSVAVPDTPV